MAIDTPQIIYSEPQLTACVRLNIPREEMRTVMDPGLSEITAALEAQGITPSGPWFTHHFRMEPGIFDFEICIPVDTRIKAIGRVEPGEWPAMRVARTVYQGPYSGLGKAWAEFGEWIASNGHKPAEDLWERYIAGPPLPTRTELNRPLID